MARAVAERVAVFGPTTAALHRATGGPLPPLSLPDPPIPVDGFVHVLVTSVDGEDPGWRGVALPRLQRSSSALTARLLALVVIGVTGTGLLARREMRARRRSSAARDE